MVETGSYGALVEGQGAVLLYVAPADRRAGAGPVASFGAGYISARYDLTNLIFPAVTVFFLRDWGLGRWRGAV